VLRDVDEREVVADERDREHCGGDDRRAEAAEERVARRVGKPAPVAARGDDPRDERVDRETEGDDERRAAEIGHQRITPKARSSCTSTGTS
jgi:hypothetical protein